MIKKLLRGRLILTLLLACSLVVGVFPVTTKASAVSNDMTYKYLAIGNSITVHPITSFWWGAYGMAASSRENDYVHQLKSLIGPYYNSVESNELYFTRWENASGGAGRTATLSYLDSYLSADLDLVTIFLGENLTDYSNLESDYQNMIDYIKARSPEAKIVMVGMFWQDEVQDEVKRTVSKRNQIAYIDLHEIMNNPEYRSYIGAIVEGDDGQKHAVNLDGVGGHPNDKAMKYIADKIFSELGLSGLIRDGVDYSDVFDASYYATNNSDVVASFGTDERILLTHFLAYGLREGRQASGYFSVKDYKNRYADLQAMFGNDFAAYCKHYIQYGISEGRTGIPMAVAEEIEAKCPENAYSMYRMFNKNSGEHLYTNNSAERQNLLMLGWYYEGVAWFAPNASDIPVYRLYNPYSGEHHYTTDSYERETLIGNGWNDENIGWYSAENTGIPLYRLFNPNAVGVYEPGAHHYTKDSVERDYLVSIGWNNENIGWYGM